MFDTIGRFGAAMKSHYRRRQAVRMLDSLPPEIQKDIGWPSTARETRRNELLTVILSTAR
ncbi:MAG: hypothetical protein J0I98_22100 [Mesorhizobium sp.]|nr:hypothetical protein [Mesorhizobium sp.]MBN9245476.1 hypothetical protein [Mesorhizobium sp.]MBN9271561.1 hypothetical protein [Mesorhizobium sp.]